MDIVHLADTVQTADTLLQQIRVERQIEHHQLTGELEVAAFGADLGTQQHLRAFLFGGEVGSGAVALDDRQPFVEHRGADRFTLAQHLLQLQRGVGLGADHQHFFVAVGQQVVQQPLDARVEVPPVAFSPSILVDLLRIQHVARALRRTSWRP